MSHLKQYLQETAEIASCLNQTQIEAMIQILLPLRNSGGRLFFLGVGGSAANASHAVNDFRKIAGFEAYTPLDNVAELTARTNDEGWEGIFAAWLKGSRLSAADVVWVFSVGGGNKEKNVSTNLIAALDYAKAQKAKIIGIVGRDGGYTAKMADACVVIPTVNAENITPHTESFQAVIWHLMVTDPRIMQQHNKWESLAVVK